MDSLRKKWDDFFNPDNIKKNIENRYAKALEPANVVNFLSGQAQNVGRAFHAVVSKDAEGRPEVKQFVAWLKRELKPV